MTGGRRKPDQLGLLWLGCDTLSWLRLLASNSFAVHRSRWAAAAAVSVFSLFHTVLRCLQQVTCGWLVTDTRIRAAPVFILGHWRTGTTLLHELLTLDPRHACPTTYDCFAPHHFVISRSWLPKLLGWPLPDRRGVDNMAAGWQHPQEDEFALCLLGVPSPYRRMAFPNQPPDDGSLDLSGLSPLELRRWKAALYQLAQGLTLVNRGRRLILKSPTHTCRIPTLLQLFPDARFVSLVRDPYVVYPSTLHLWRFLYTVHGLQPPAWQDLPEFILGTFVHMDERLQEGKRLLAPGRFQELRYEDLVRDPVGQLEALYQALDLGDFTAARPHIEAYLPLIRAYETNRYILTAEERQAITDRWGEVIRRYGYPTRQDSE
jgi:hypothetical protein